MVYTHLLLIPNKSYQKRNSSNTNIINNHIGMFLELLLTHIKVLFLEHYLVYNIGSIQYMSTIVIYIIILNYYYYSFSSSMTFNLTSWLSIP